MALALATLLGGCSAREGGGSASPAPGAAASTSSAGTGATSATGPAAPGGFAAPVLLGDVDGDVTESSGLAASRRNPGLIWTHNDSGDRPRLYCLTRKATTCGTWQVTGASAFDWEDMAAGPGPTAGEPYLYVGDIGDNRQARDEIAVYRLVEPAAPSPRAGVVVPTSPADRLELRYEDGRHDAEALLVHPRSGDLYVITKDFAGGAVYKASAGTSILRRIADLEIGLGDVVTGGDIAPDGTRVAVSTYGRGFEMTLPVGARSFDDVWKQRPRPVELAARSQGESIAYRLDGDALLTTSEHSPFGLHEVVRR